MKEVIPRKINIIQKEKKNPLIKQINFQNKNLQRMISQHRWDREIYFQHQMLKQLLIKECKKMGRNTERNQ